MKSFDEFEFSFFSVTFSGQPAWAIYLLSFELDSERSFVRALFYVALNNQGMHISALFMRSRLFVPFWRKKPWDAT